MSKTETTETRFTPGPWRISHLASTLVTADEGRSVATCGGYSTNMVDPDVLLAENESNARLIAASPEMYEALEWCGHVLNGVLGDPDWKDEPDAIKAYEWVHQILARVRGEG